VPERSNVRVVCRAILFYGAVTVNNNNASRRRRLGGARPVHNTGPAREAGMTSRVRPRPAPTADDSVSRLPHTVYQGSRNGVDQASERVRGPWTAQGATRRSLAWMPESSRTTSARRRPGLSRICQTIVRVALTQLYFAHQFLTGRGCGAPRAWSPTAPSSPLSPSRTRGTRESSSVGPLCPTASLGATGGLSASVRPRGAVTSDDAVATRIINAPSSPCSPCLRGETPVLILGPGGDYRRAWPACRDAAAGADGRGR